MPLTPEEKRLRNREKVHRYYHEHKAERDAYQREWYRQNRDELLARRRKKYLATQPSKIISDEKHQRQRAAQKRSYEKHKEKYQAKRRAAYHANKHWLYIRNRRLAFQQAEAERPRPDCCEVCGDSNVRIEFDHCHQRGVFRGWLCTHCNIILGHARDDPNRLRKLIAYLGRTKDLVDPQLTLPGL